MNPILIPYKNGNKQLHRRILTVVALAFLGLTGYFLVSDYITTLNHAEKLTLQRLEGIVQNAALSIDPEVHYELSQAYVKKDEILKKDQDAKYEKIHNTLKHSLESHKLNSPIYTFIKSGNGNELNFIATSSDEPYYRHSYTSLPEDAFKQLDEGGSVGLYKDEFGHWLSAYMPIKRSNGQVIGYVQADEKFDYFIAEVRNTTIWNALFSFMGCIVSIVLLLPYLKSLLVHEERNKDLLTNALKETRSLTHKLETNEQKLKDYANKLEQSNKDLTDFAHIASHDLKAPVRNICSFAQLILRRTKGQLDDSVQEYLNFIVQNGDRAQSLINGLLSYSTADKNIGEPVKFSMHDAVVIAQQNLSSVIDEKGARVVFEKMPEIMANRTLVSQVMQNLINNGIKYNQSESPLITVGMGCCDERGDYFFVQDNGIGIPENYQKEIFNMFTRLHGNGEYEGSGIGLAFCKRVVNTYGGQLWLKSKKDEGATFFFTLPKAAMHAFSETAVA